MLTQLLHARFDQRIVGRRKGQLVDQHALQRVARHVYALPETLRAQQHAATTLAKALQQTAPRLAALHQQRQRVAQALGLVAQCLCHQGQRSQRGGQHKGAPAQRAGAARRELTHRLGVPRFVGLGAARRHPQPRMRRVVEGAAHAQHGGVFQARGGGEPGQFGVVAQRGRGEDPGLGREPALFAEHFADIQRRLHQPRLLRRQVYPAHIAAGHGVVETLRQGGQRTRTLFELGEIRRRFGHASNRLGGRPRRFAQGLQRGLQRVVGAAFFPAQLEHAAHFAGIAVARQPQLTRGQVDGALQLAPGLQAAGVHQAQRQDVTRQVNGLPGRQGGAQELHAGLDELMRLVEHGGVHRGQQLGHAAVAQGHVSEEEVVVDDHQVGGHGLAPGLHDMAGAELGALAAQAVVACGRDERDDGRAVVQAFDFGQVAAARGLGPQLDPRQRARGKAVGHGAFVHGLGQAVPAQVAGTPLEQGHAHGHAQRVTQPWQVAQEELVLQALGGGADQRAAARQQQGHQVGEGLAHARASFGDQGLAAVQGLGHARSHLVLRRTRAVARIAAGQGAVDRERLGHGLHQARSPHAGSGGSTCTSSRAIWSRNSSRRFLSRRRLSSSVGGPTVLRSMRLSRSACSMRNSMSWRCGECRFSFIASHLVDRGEFIFRYMVATAQTFRFTASTGLHRGDRAYQQDQVELINHPRVAGTMMAVLADGMGGKSGGRKAADQVLLTARQIFERYSPSQDDPAELLRQLVVEAHLMIKLTAITSEEEPHSTVAGYMIGAGLECDVVHAGDSRVYHYRGAEMMKRTIDHSYVQRLVDEGKITDEQANTHPQSNLLTGCLGTQTEPPVTLWHIDKLEHGDSVLACSDGLWHYFTPKEIGAILHALPPREASEMLISKARQRARGGGDNLSLALSRIDTLR